MTYALPAIALLAGLVLGVFAAWLFFKVKGSKAAAETRAELEPQLATLKERVAAREQQLAQLQSGLQAEEDQKTQLAMQLQQEATARASAEEKTNRIPELEEQVKAREEQIQRVRDQAKAELEALHGQIEQAGKALSTATARLEAEDKARAELVENQTTLVSQLEGLQAALLEQQRRNGELTERAKFLEERLGTERQQLEHLQQKFQKEFEAVAHKLLVDNSSRFGQQSVETLDKLLGPLRENLQDFKVRLDTVHKETVTHTALLKDQIGRIGAEAANLSKALKGNVKVLGNWGENMLDQILAKSGLQLGVHYRRQHGTKDEAGDQRFLDVVVELPEEKHLVIDSKVSLRAYEDYVNCTDDGLRLKHLESHVTCIRSHFRGLGGKAYHESYGINTPDFVLMYIPIEAAFFVALGEEPNLFSEALEKNVVLITNSTLLATLRTVANVWRLADQQKYALEIADRGGKLYDKFAGFVEDLQKIGAHLKDTQEAWEDANKKLYQGSGHLIGQVEKLKALGVKASKKLPAQLTAEAEIEAPPENRVLGNGGETGNVAPEAVAPPKADPPPTGK
jgi:DNA recombination protein RmuC